MNRRLLTIMFALFAIATSARAAVAINETNFPDANFRAWVKANCQSDGNNSLSDAEIAAVKTIEVPDMNITDLKGIERFTALTSLDCSANQLTSLDVSQNTALETLYCDFNELTSLDLSNNNALKQVVCSYNQLTSFVVSKNASSLYMIYCFANQIKGAAMDRLVESWPDKNATKYLCVILDEATEGNVMTVQQVAAAKEKKWTAYYLNENNSWVVYKGSTSAGIDINENYFPDANFRAWVKANCDDGDDYLTEAEMAAVKRIDVSEMEITTLKGIEHFTALVYLFCSDNKLSALNLSKNAMLQYLYCYNNQLTSLDLSHNTALVFLYCSDNQLTVLDLSNNNALNSVICSSNRLVSFTVSKNAIELNRIICFYNQIKGVAMNSFVQSLPESESEKSLLGIVKDDLEGNVMTVQQVAAAKTKKWNVLCSENLNNWNYYEGEDVSTPTAIPTLSPDAATTSPFFSLDGQRIVGKPTKKGVYVRNGRKVVVK